MERSCTQDESPDALDAKSLPVSTPSQRLILLVEDEDFVREVTREVLLFAGYRVLSARSIGEALDAFKQNDASISLLMADHKLPDGEGCALARQLMAAHPGLKAIIVSGYPRTQVEQTERNGEERDISYLAKPFSTDILLRAVRYALDNTSEPPPMAKSAVAS